jgi:hypothetical protein
MSPFNHHRKLQDLGMKDRALARSFANFPVGYGDATATTQVQLHALLGPSSLPDLTSFPVRGTVQEWLLLCLRQ